jgi:hypothetical protein
MMVYVCYWDYGAHGGAGEPEAVYRSEGSAREWCQRMDAKHACVDGAQYVELELED